MKIYPLVTALALIGFGCQESIPDIEYTPPRVTTPPVEDPGETPETRRPMNDCMAPDIAEAVREQCACDIEAPDSQAVQAEFQRCALAIITRDMPPMNALNPCTAEALALIRDAVCPAPSVDPEMGEPVADVRNELPPECAPPDDHDACESDEETVGRCGPDGRCRRIPRWANDAVPTPRTDPESPRRAYAIAVVDG